MPPDASPLDDARRLVLDLRRPEGLAKGGTHKADGLGRPGRLVEIADRIAALRAPRPLLVDRGHIVVFAGSHGVATRGVSTIAATEVAAAVARIGEGTDPLNALCAAGDLGLKLFELALEVPTADFTEAPALDERACAATVAFGMEAVAGGADLLALGALGAGGEAASAAIFAALGGGGAETWAGGDHLPEHVRRRQVEAVEEALIRHRGDLNDPLAILHRVGGREHAAIFGAIVAARTERVAVLLDGPVAASAALLLHRLNPEGLAHCFLAHRLAVPAQGEAAAQAGLLPLLDLGLFAGDGQAGAIAAGVVKAAVVAANAAKPAR
ncbi:MAG TPA: nicotinate-nucleotide--dimethylbenzimidazole phosphoribosyltransferase [Mesorhizobium sp.]|nr:nicotinate-nucleotide--dimethylbenzimidazole phosphoribosyltransferase [Mesorhizobium sp.]